MAPTTLVMSDHRPVPLAFSFCSAKGLHPLLNDEEDGACIPTARVWRAPKGERRKGKSSRPPQPEAAPLPFVVAQMAERDMLPAIYFIFSRRACDKAVRDLGRICLVSEAEQAVIDPAALTPSWRPRLRRCGRAATADALRRGDCLTPTPGCCRPGKELIEELFPAGVGQGGVCHRNPGGPASTCRARTTVISAPRKRTEAGHRPLMGQ